ncbi:hypothetical protein BW723_04145 [Polaribacter reichenbachii]|uniref:Apiosidase-like catalytic domain-containing protein n=1 Tax=Polaribacter reichenbachii TaxID=996801 RepID=A0A1B8TV65_9FLAO|nr:DUF4038 domain-containing protein [Polaribacter reichenbachii]APZ45533.1 hypothetical protein BW723_04145 [Polaribacter reichenbachii]AUC19395.1 hypothetical protein BTO17_12150 [Polaribacter reichenbachii]OBY63450.1 hypothetical protein LPB301_11565 [Polaribacter reichenbachii]
MNIKSTIFLSLLLCITTCFSQIKKWENPKKNKTIETTQWQVNDIIYKVKKSVDDPLNQEVFAIVTGNDGIQKIPVFYNGDKKWIFRYSGNTIGERTYVLQSKIKELNGKKGKILVTENQKKNRHGGVVLKADNPQHFFYQDGSHYFNLAFECDWLFALDYGQKEIPKTKHLLSKVTENGFNQIVMNVYSHDVKWQKDKKLANHPEHEYGGREDIFPFLGSNSKPDFSTLNIEFFQHFDKVIAEMHDQEIVSHLMIYVWNKLVSWPDMQSDADNLYYDYVVKRYQAFPNIIWDVSKEALFYGRATEEYIAERIERTRKIDAYNRLVSVHDFGFCKRNPDKVDFISMQNWQHMLYKNMIDARKQFPKKPIFNIEHGGYEKSPYVVFPGAYTDAEACLRRNYMCLFAGGYTTYYWQGTSWNVVIHNPFEQPEGFIKPKFEYFKHLKTLFTDYNFQNFKPIQWFNGNGYNLTNEKDGVVMLFVPKENNWVGVVEGLKKKFDFSEAKEVWFNTLTGEYTEEESFDKKAYNFWKKRPWHLEADAIRIVKNLKLKN